MCVTPFSTVSVIMPLTYALDKCNSQFHYNTLIIISEHSQGALYIQSLLPYVTVLNFDILSRISHLSLCSHLEITRVISRTKSGFVYVDTTSPDQWPGSVVRENTRTSDPGTTFGPDQLICERYSFLGPPLWRCGLYEEERTHSGSWLAL